MVLVDYGRMICDWVRSHLFANKVMSEEMITRCRAEDEGSHEYQAVETVMPIHDVEQGPRRSMRISVELLGTLRTK